MGYEERNVERKQYVRRFYNIKCDNCDAPIEPFSYYVTKDSDGGVPSPTIKSADIKISLWGGDDHVEAQLCEPCTEKLFELFPGLRPWLLERYVEDDVPARRVDLPYFNDR